MSVTGVSNITTQVWQGTMQQRKLDFSQLAQALQQGDLTGAQKAFADLQSLSQPQSGSSSTSASSNTSSNGTSALADDFAALGKALQAGNLADAQSAFAKIQSDMKANKGGHHHHHHGTSSASSSSTGQSSTSTTEPLENSTISISA